jgi:hypothetical protein
LDLEDIIGKEALLIERDKQASNKRDEGENGKGIF